MTDSELRVKARDILFNHRKKVAEIVEKHGTERTTDQARQQAMIADVRALADQGTDAIMQLIAQAQEKARLDENNTAFLRIFKIARTAGLTAKNLVKYHDMREAEIKAQLHPKESEGGDRA